MQQRYNRIRAQFQVNENYTITFYYQLISINLSIDIYSALEKNVKISWNFFRRSEIVRAWEGSLGGETLVGSCLERLGFL